MRSGLLVILTVVLLLPGCRSKPSDTSAAPPEGPVAGESPKPAEKPAPTETLTAVGWVQNPHTEYFHTIIGFRTTDEKLLNLIFPGWHQQLTDGTYCRITYHRLSDDDHLPNLIRKYTRKAKVDYYVIDAVDPLPPLDKEGAVKKIHPKRRGP